MHWIATLSVITTLSALVLAASLENQYIVRLKPHSTSLMAIHAHLNEFNRNAQVQGVSDAPEQNKIQHEFTHVMSGFTGTFTQEYLDTLKQRFGASIRDITPNAPMHAFIPVHAENNLDEQASPVPSWGLTRVSQRKLDLSQPYRYAPDAGKGIQVYVIDTGIVANHSDFEGRAQMAASFIEGEEPWDLNGHGTHCAGTIASKTYGVAKKANVFGVKVLDAEGSGSIASVISGIEFVAPRVQPGKTVVSMSLGTPFFPLLFLSIHDIV